MTYSFLLFVVEGRWVALTPGVVLPGVRPPGGLFSAGVANSLSTAYWPIRLVSETAAQTIGSGHTRL